ncbi:hypothetical protein BBO99_00004350 [Phytophthora kernoviae]|uniref:Bromo domain-containing protein n=2 Tax=Phytophthora kernoviae TaxID=325452 RepID=A0A3R7GKA3_9STRA|nr:hypothetical protein G195_003085 [Phytophthora kernoviae 00238/432]KAG2526015.1 hypothetical protein JM16_002483 [Phytophthora kernoviae]KAG2527729.1 hypothetical protein JM18_002290 [Phytophthora kernoviae]RLN10960.1 hypothetical protein BBI17_000780 [Phytophthora kernoviae]RLN80650.1 hypothetical protein BBO99_00004350 [Phytophthora kernoviae]
MIKTEKHAEAVTKKAKSMPDLPREVLQYAPLLVGKYYIQDKRAVWSGMWGMSEAAFGPNGIISRFEMKSQDDVSIPMCDGAADTAHPALSGLALARSSNMVNRTAREVSPVYFGYETDASVRSAMPFAGKYSGSFEIQAVKGKHQTVPETDVEIHFLHDVGIPSQFIVSGTGENRFGVFALHGFLDKETNEMRLYKVYKPKEPVKRTLPRRGRAARPATPAMKREVKALSISAPGVAAITATSVTPKIVTPISRPSIVAPHKVSTPMSDYSSPSLMGRGRSERKRVMPAHLREGNILELDHAPTSLKKCHGILKGLMANPKAAPFLAPVDPIALGIPDYFHVIKEPMDLGTIRTNLESGVYESPLMFSDQVRLVFQNAMLYNASHSQVHIYAHKLLDDFEKRFKSLNLKLSTKDKLYKQSSMKMKKDRKTDIYQTSKKIKGGKGTKGNTKRRMSGDDTGLIMSLKEDIERLKATLEQLQPSMAKAVSSKPKVAARPFKMEDLTEEELNEPMSQMDKARLSSDIKLLPQDKINRVLQIIAEAVPVAKLANENDEVELDINAFDTRCLRMLEGYVRENGIGRKHAAKKIRDEQLSSTEPLRVENRGAWSMLAKKDTPNGTPAAQSTESQSSSLWLSARSMEQIKQQKIQQKEKERTDELQALKRRETEQREKEKQREQQERRKIEQEQSAKLAEEKRLREERAREAERARLEQIAIQREKLARDDDVELHDATLSEDLESFSSSSFL